MRADVRYHGFCISRTESREEEGERAVASYIAHYESPKGENPQSGEFDFESEHPLNSKANQQDARYRMLDVFGKEAVSWQITKVTRAKADTPDSYLQPTLDFREPEKKRRRHTVQRGRL